LWTLVYGVLWNGLGWAGNNFLLGEAWDIAKTDLQPNFSPPWTPLVRELMSFVSDFVYAGAFVWLFSQLRVQSATSALAVVTALWLSGAAVTYLAIVNSGFLPWPIALQSSVLALVIFVATAPFVAWARRS
jgi:hypothetical protein